MEVLKLLLNLKLLFVFIPHPVTFFDSKEILFVSHSTLIKK